MKRQVESPETRIVAAYRSGKSIKSIARENKVSEYFVCKILAESGVTGATPTAQIIAKMYSGGASVGTIARELKISRNAVEKYLPYMTSPRRPWTQAEDDIVLSGKIPDGRTQDAANVRRHRLKSSPSRAQWASSPLRDRRTAERLTQAELSKLSDVPVSTIQAFEQGKRDINAASVSIIERLAGALHCSDYRDILSKKL